MGADALMCLTLNSALITATAPLKQQPLRLWMMKLLRSCGIGVPPWLVWHNSQWHQWWWWWKWWSRPSVPMDCQLAWGNFCTFLKEHLRGCYQLSFRWPISEQADNRNSQVMNIYSAYTSNYLQKYYGSNSFFTFFFLNRSNASQLSYMEAVWS